MTESKRINRLEEWSKIDAKIKFHVARCKVLYLDSKIDFTNTKWERGVKTAVHLK